MSDLSRIAEALRAFRDDRQWQPFHSPKNLAMALAGETGELVELFQWLTEAQSRALDAETRAKVIDEIADVQMYLVMLADQLAIDIPDAVDQKMVKNAKKYPVETSRGHADRPR